METPVKRVLRAQNTNRKLEDLGTPLKIPSSPFLVKLGCGTGIEVVRFKRRALDIGGTSPWAIKRVTKKAKSDVAETYTSRLGEEARFLRNLNHPNIIGFRAFKLSNDGRPCLAMEECNTSLGDYLEQRFEDSEGPMSHTHINKVSFDVSLALDYLHTVAMLIHGDIKSFNILIKGDFITCKLCDFGVSQPIDENGFIDVIKKSGALYVGTDLWSAPEVFEDPTQVSVKADIFSFGMTIYEMLSLQPPHTLNNDVSHLTEESFNESNSDIGLDIPLGSRPALPDAFDFPTNYCHIIELFYTCTHEDPESRPTAKMITELVTAINELTN